MSEYGKLRMIVEFMIEPKEGQSIDDAVDEMTTTLGQTLGDADGPLYTNYGPAIAQAVESNKTYTGHPGPYVVGIQVKRQDNTNKAAVNVVEKTMW